MNTVSNTTGLIETEVVNIISSVTHLSANQLVQVRDLAKLGLDVLDVLDVILEVEQAYDITIPDEVPVYTVDDLVDYVHRQLGNVAGTAA
ncbi:acyl carrier protein [Pontibacter ummariensis]|uniref:Acyl carrier protein n=1 Tax=Pontibacter ummariensis TaxID=1610492 RepID=A0A239GIH8_9BACT|nr:phosphopantetheine-binding protein [Pontibacter ummariensis]PRY11287.1 acyl carrier protein [Pontibacter ummariensis]SNS68940.1 acyl carrier protein [Pontibacter ummariensis]